MEAEHPGTVTQKRKTSLTLDAASLAEARALGVNVSAVADAALKQAVATARREQWLKDNAEALAAQSDWHRRNGHPLADILVAPGAGTWSS